MKLQYELTYQEYKKSQVAVVKKRPAFYVFLVFVFVWAAFTSNMLSSPKNSSNAILFIEILALVFAYMSLTFFIRVKKSWNESVRVGLSTTLELTSEEITIERHLLTIRAKRDFYKKSIETPDCFVLYLFPRPPCILQFVPKRAFADESDLNQFREWASQIGQNDAPFVAPIPQP